MPNNTWLSEILSQYNVSNKIREVRFTAIGITITSSLYSFFKNPSMRDLDNNSTGTTLGMLMVKYAVERNPTNLALVGLSAIAIDLLARTLWYNVGLSPKAAYFIAAYSMAVAAHFAAQGVEKLEIPRIRP